MPDQKKRRVEVAIPVEKAKGSPESKEVTITPLFKWRENEAPFTLVDQFLVRRQGNQLFLLAGHVGLPLMTGSLEEQAEHAAVIRELPVYIRGKFVMERNTAKGLVQILGGMLANWEE